MTVEYTEYAEPDSSLVEGAWYDERNRTAAVDLNERVYGYKNVPAEAFKALVEARSVGREYSRFKRNYGPGEFLGYCYDLDFDKVNDVTGEVPAGTPKNLTYASNAVVDGEPVNSTTGAAAVYNLYVDAPEASAPVGEKRSHEVFFSVNGNDHSYTVAAGSVDEAVAALETVGAALGLDFTVEGVYVSFE